MYDLAIWSWGCLNSTDHVPVSHCSLYGSISEVWPMNALGRIVRMKLVEEMASLDMIVKGVNRGGSKILVVSPLLLAA